MNLMKDPDRSPFIPKEPALILILFCSTGLGYLPLDGGALLGWRCVAEMRAAMLDSLHNLLRHGRHGVLHASPLLCAAPAG